MAVESYSGFAQRYNIMLGVLLFAFSTSIMLLILPELWFFFIGDIFLLVGGSIGLYFTFKNRKESQSYIKTGIIVGLIGSVLSLVLISFFEWILYSLEYEINFILFLQNTIFLFTYYGIIYALVGLTLGYLFGNQNRKRETLKRESPYFK